MLELTPAIEVKALELIAAKKGMTTLEVEEELKDSAVIEATHTEIAEITQRIQRKKVDEANSYQPTDEEIIAALEAKMPAPAKEEPVQEPV